MVYLSRIYTKTGDAGDTGLGDGSRVPKDHPRVAAYGSVDELNALLGIFVLELPPEVGSSISIRSVQNDLFDVGADLCLPSRGRRKGAARAGRASRPAWSRPSIGFNERLQPLKSFILPGGTNRRRHGAIWPAPSAAGPSAMW